MGRVHPLFAEALEPRALLSVAPVASVTIGDTSWSADFVDYLRNTGQGDGGRQVFPTGGGSDPLLSFTRLNQVKVHFSEPAAVTQADLIVEGIALAEYPVASFSYDAEHLTGAWTLAIPITLAERLTLSLGDTVYPLNVVPGDVSGDGRVNAIDLVQVRNRIGRTVFQPGTGTSAYFAAADLDGTGRINASDLVLVRNHVSQGLPEIVEWINPAGGAWENPANWNTHVLPTQNDHVLIDVPGGGVVTLGSNTTVRSLRTNSPFTLRQGTLQTITGLRVEDVFTLDAATLVNTRVLVGSPAASIVAQGNVTLRESTLGVDLTVQPAGVLNVVRSLTFTNDTTLTVKGRMMFPANEPAAVRGGGTIRLDNGFLRTDNTLDIDPGVTLRGFGVAAAVDPNPASMIRHQGLIVADQPGKTLQVSRNKAQGAGALRVESGATLELGYNSFLDFGVVDVAGLPKITRDGPNSKVVLSGALANVGRTTVFGDAQGPWEIAGAAVDRGVIAGFGGSPLVIRSVVLRQVTLANDLTVPAGGRLTAQESLTFANNVTVTVAGATADTESAVAFFSSSSTLELNGAGTLKLETSTTGPARLLGIAPFTIGSGFTVRGAVDGSITAVVEGSLIADVPGGTMGLASVLNRGLVQVATDSTLAAQSLSNQGTLDLRPGGTVSLIGNFTATAESTVRIGLTGVAPTPARYGRLNIGGDATLAGALVFAPDESFLSTPGDTLTLLAFASHSRPFDSIRGDVLEDGHVLDVQYLATGVTAEVKAV